MTRQSLTRRTVARTVGALLLGAAAAGTLVTAGPAQAAGTATVPGDSFGAPIAASGPTGAIIASNTGATGQAGEPSHSTSVSGVIDPPDRSLWIRWKSPVSARVTFRTSGSAIDTVMAAYTGSSLAALTRIASNDDTAMPGPDGSPSTVQSQIHFTAVKGTIYRIAVDSFTGSTVPVPTGAIDLSWDANDQLGAATSLDNPADGFAEVVGQNIGASAQAGEPLHAGRTGGHSLWYRWTAPKTGTVTFNTFESQIDTLLAAYTGTDVGNLHPIVSSDDVGSDPTSQILMEVTAGTTYKIAVDGFAGAEGAIRLAYGYTIRQP